MSSVSSLSRASQPVDPSAGTDVVRKSHADATYAAIAHNHAGAEITSGTVAYARLPVGTTASTVAAGDDSRITGAVPNTRSVTAGTGLTGGGTLAADRTLAVSYGTAAGTAAQGNDTRITGAAPATRLVSAGTGLTGGGDLSADRTLAVSYGTASGTAAQGNDTRITGAEQAANKSTAAAKVNNGYIGADASGNVAAGHLYVSTSSADGVVRLSGDLLGPSSAYNSLQVTRGPMGGVTAVTGATGTVTPVGLTNGLRYTATGDLTINLPTNAVDGQRLWIEVLASGATRVVTFASGYELSGSVPGRGFSVASGAVGTFLVVCRIVSAVTTWRIVTADPLPLPTGIPAFTGRQSTAQLLTANVLAAIALATEDLDNYNGHSTVTNNSRYTATAAGWYWVVGALGTLGTSGAGLTGSITGSRAVTIYKNGAENPGCGTWLTATSTTGAATRISTIPKLIFLDGSTDYVEVWGFSTVNVHTEVTAAVAPGLTVAFHTAA